LKNKITIAIDGYSSTGKSTLAKQLAQYLGYVYVDSGAMYRAITLYAMEYDFITLSFFKVHDFVLQLDKIKLNFVFNEALGFSEMFLNNRNVEQNIRSLEVSNLVSKIAAVPEIRQQLVKQQQSFGKNKGVVMDGRDIGTVVFPRAKLKVFMTASPEIRAKRRYEELLDRGDTVTYEQVLKNVNERDYIDSNRKDSPLRKATDAIAIDNSNLSLAAQFDLLKELVDKLL
jgi:cytidylate kinase